MAGRGCAGTIAVADREVKSVFVERFQADVRGRREIMAAEGWRFLFAPTPQKAGGGRRTPTSPDWMHGRKKMPLRHPVWHQGPRALRANGPTLLSPGREPWGSPASTFQANQSAEGAILDSSGAFAATASGVERRTEKVREQGPPQACYGAGDGRGKNFSASATCPHGWPSRVAKGPKSQTPERAGVNLAAGV